MDYWGFDKKKERLLNIYIIKSNDLEEVNTEIMKLRFELKQIKNLLNKKYSVKLTKNKIRARHRKIIDNEKLFIVREELLNEYLIKDNYLEELEKEKIKLIFEIMKIKTILKIKYAMNI